MFSLSREQFDEDPFCEDTYATLVHLLDAVERAAGALRGRHGLEADFSCFWVSALGYGGPTISPATLARIAALDAQLGFDFFGP